MVRQTAPDHHRLIAVVVHSEPPMKRGFLTNPAPDVYGLQQWAWDMLRSGPEGYIDLCAAIPADDPAERRFALLLIFEIAGALVPKSRPLLDGIVAIEKRDDWARFDSRVAARVSDFANLRPRHRRRRSCAP